MSLKRVAVAWGIALSVLGFWTNSQAVDGVVLIDQNRALAGNITPGDIAGFPVSITRSGSYRLSGNLTVPAGVDGLEIVADDVTLDLNGFAISGGGASAAIRVAAAQRGIAIGNGAINGFGSGIMALTSTHVIVRDVRSTNVSSVSIATGRFSTIQRNSVGGLIQAECPSVITENVTEGFITVVLSAGPDAPRCVRWNNRSLNFEGDVTQ